MSPKGGGKASGNRTKSLDSAVRKVDRKAKSAGNSPPDTPGHEIRRGWIRGASKGGK